MGAPLPPDRPAFRGPPTAVPFAPDVDLRRWLLRAAPGERWFPDDIVAVDASISEQLLPLRRLRVDVARRRNGKGAVLSREIACVPAYACYRDLCWWLRSIAVYDPEAEEMVVEWSSALAERIVDAAQEA